MRNTDIDLPYSVFLRAVFFAAGADCPISAPFAAQRVFRASETALGLAGRFGWRWRQFGAPANG